MKRIIKYTLSVVVGFAIIIALMIYTGVEDIWSTLLRMDPIWLTPMIIAYAADWLVRGYRWKLILRTSDVDLSVTEASMHTLIGNTANLVVPAKLGDLARVYSIKRVHNVDYGVGLSSVFFDRVFDFMAVALITIGLFLAAPLVDLPGWTAWILLGAAALAGGLLAVIVLVIKRPQTVKKMFKGPLKRFEGYFNKVQHAFEAMVTRPETVMVLVILSITIWMLEAVVTYFLALALHIFIPFWIIMFIIMMANLTKTLPVTPGALGPYEWVFSALFIAFGLSLVSGTTLGFVDHLFKNIFTIVCGGFAASWLGIRLSKISKITTLT